MATSAEATYNLWFSTGILPQNGRNIQIEDVIIMYIIYIRIHIYIHYMVQILIGAAQQSFSEKKESTTSTDNICELPAQRFFPSA